MNDPLSPQQLKQLYFRLTGDTIDIVQYDRIISTQSLGSLLGKRNKIIIFYPALKDSTTNTVFGHYCALIHDPDEKVLKFYDPLGYKPDVYKRFTHNRNSLYGEQQNSLIGHLLSCQREGCVIDFNQHQHQSRRSDVATCGRHCVVRCMYGALTTEDYDRLLHLGRLKYGIGDRLKDRLILRLTQ